MLKIKASPKAILYALASMIGCGALFSFISLISPVFNYIAYSDRIPVEIEKIEILEMGENLFVPKAIYTYANIKKEEVLETFTESNPYLLEQKLKEWTHGENVGYLNYSNQCTLQKCFPVKQSVYTLILIGLALYFLFLAKVKI